MTDEVTPKNAAIDLQAIIAEEREKRIQAENLAQAIVEEFTQCNNFEDVRQKFREKIREVAPIALTNIVTMMNNAESESVRASLNKWVIEWAMSDKIDGSGGELQRLLSDLRKNDAVISTPGSDQQLGPFG